MSVTLPCVNMGGRGKPLGRVLVEAIEVIKAKTKCVCDSEE